MRQRRQSLVSSRSAAAVFVAVATWTSFAPSVSLALTAPAHTAARRPPLGARSDYQAKRLVLRMAADTDFDSKAFLAAATGRMQKSLESLEQNLVSLRTGRASPDMLARVTVSYYGADTPLQSLASVSVSSGTQLVVSPYDKSTLKDIDSALLEANLGMTPSNDGEVIRLNVPQLTEDRRKEILKQAKSIGEDAKVAIRNIRRASNDDVKKLQKSKDISEDAAKEAADDVQKLTDKMIKDVDKIVQKKEAEIMKV